MESPDLYNFSIFSPRNNHGRKNRNVILSMLLIWAVAVFGFQFLLRVIEKPVPEKTLAKFESTWPSIKEGEPTIVDYQTFLQSLLLVKGKGTVKPEDQLVLKEAISCVTYRIMPDSVKPEIISALNDNSTLKEQLIQAIDQEYLDIKTRIVENNNSISSLTVQYSGLSSESLETAILTGSLVVDFHNSFEDAAYERLPLIMQLYLTHNQSILTDFIFLGFPFHYFYTAVFLLILFIGLCIVYNILIERRLKKDKVSD